MNIESIDTCLNPIKAMEAQSTKVRTKPVFLSQFESTKRDKLLLKTTDFYENVELENTKEFRQLELKQL